MAYSTLFAMAMIDNSRGVSYPIILKDMDLGTRWGSLIFTLSSLSGLIGNLTSKYWLARIGANKAIRICIWILIIGSVGIGLSKILNSPAFLYFASFFIGFGFAGSAVTMNILVAKGTPEKYRRRFLSGLHSVYGFGSLISPLIFTYVLSEGINWWTFYFILALLPFIIYLPTLALNEEPALEKQKKALVAPIGAKVRGLYGACLGLYVSSEILISSRLVYYLENVWSFDTLNSGRALSIYFFSLMLGRVLFAMFHLHLKNKVLLLISLVLTQIVIVLGIVFNPWILCFSGFTMSWFFPTCMDWVSERFPRGGDFMMASSLSSMNVCLVFFHWFYGQLNQTIGAEKTFYLAPICSLLSLFFLALLWRRTSKNSII